MTSSEPLRGVKAPKPYRDLAKKFPDLIAAYERLGKEVRLAGPLSPREVALVKLGISVGARMEGAAHAHARKALAQDIEPDALEQVALLSCPTVGFPNMMAALGWVRDVTEEPGR